MAPSQRRNNPEQNYFPKATSIVQEVLLGKAQTTACKVILDSNTDILHQKSQAPRYAQM